MLELVLYSRTLNRVMTIKIFESVNVLYLITNSVLLYMDYRRSLKTKWLPIMSFTAGCVGNVKKIVAKGYFVTASIL